MTSDFKQRLIAAFARHEPGRALVAGAREAAVLIPIYAAPEPTLIFTARTDSLPSHKGQISFPGGSIDPTDESAAAAALREAEEELGLAGDQVTVIGELDTTPTYVSGYVIQPFVGWIERRPRLRPNPAEVAAVLEVPLASLLDEIRFEPGFSHGGRTYPTEAWVWKDHVIWGVTARLLRMLLEHLGAAGLVRAPAPSDWWARLAPSP